MVELAALDRDSYREIRLRCRRIIADAHSKKTPAQIAAWRDNAS